ncbi:MAG: M23 family metallopeptidase [Bacteroidetes bacterium]|nr:M23 family metallopeptidase [Bacteroidota bacterium]
MNRSAILAILVFLLPALPVSAQQDSIRLICPLNDAIVVPPPKNVIHYDQEDLCVVLKSIPDSVVKSAGTGRVTNTEYTEESKNGVVLYLKLKGKDYYIWYTGLDKLLVKRNDVVKIGQPLGYINSGGKLELVMYQFETPVDPIKFFDCKGVLGRQ